MTKELDGEERRNVLRLVEQLAHAEAEGRETSHDWPAKQANRQHCRDLEAKIDSLLPDESD